MYTISRGPSKLVTQRRTGPTQQVESKFAEPKFRPTSWTTSSSSPPKIVFNRLNGKRYHAGFRPESSGAGEGFTPEHEENVRFVHEAWQEVERESSRATVRYAEKTHGGVKNKTNRASSCRICQPIMWSRDDHVMTQLDFVPMDLDEWWAKRFLANIAGLS